MKMPRAATVLMFAWTWTAAAQLPPAWQNWQYFRSVTAETGSGERLAEFVCPAPVYAHSEGGLTDLRLIDDQGVEAAHVLQARLWRCTREWRNVRMLEPSFLPGSYTQVVLDTAERRIHNAVELETEERDFFMRVEVAAGGPAALEDEKAWRVLRDRSPIYRFKKDGLEGNQIISYPDSYSRYLRLRILDGGKLFPISRCRVAREVVEQAELLPLGVDFSSDAQAPPGQSWWRGDLGAAQMPVSQVRFTVAKPEFHRPVKVFSSQDGKEWVEAGWGEIYRMGREKGEGPQERLQVDLTGARGRYWRIAVFNRNDPPLEGLQVELLGTPRHVVFRPQAGRRYRLLYGNSRATAPQYEMAHLTGRNAFETAAPATLGPEETNSAYADPRPWSEQHTVLMWLALGIAVAVLGFMALQALRAGPQKAQD